MVFAVCTYSYRILIGRYNMDSINVTFGLFGIFIAWMAIDQLLIFQYHTSIGELLKKLYIKLRG